MTVKGRLNDEKTRYFSCKCLPSRLHLFWKYTHHFTPQESARAMLTIEEIRDRMISGKRKWGGSLVALILPKLQQGLSYESVARWLLCEHGLSISAKKLKDLKLMHSPGKKPLPVPAPSMTPTPAPESPEEDVFDLIRRQTNLSRETEKNRRNADFFAKTGRK